jgi:putative endonuclease
MIEIKRQTKEKEKKTIYTGYTSNLTKRIDEHKTSKGARYTKKAKEIKLLYTESFSTRGEAMKREIEIKKLSRKEKELLISNYSSLPNYEPKTEN